MLRESQIPNFDHNPMKIIDAPMDTQSQETFNCDDITAGEASSPNKRTRTNTTCGDRGKEKEVTITRPQKTTSKNIPPICQTTQTHPISMEQASPAPFMYSDPFPEPHTLNPNVIFQPRIDVNPAGDKFLSFPPKIPGQDEEPTENSSKALAQMDKAVQVIFVVLRSTNPGDFGVLYPLDVKGNFEGIIMDYTKKLDCSADDIFLFSEKNFKCIGRKTSAKESGVSDNEVLTVHQMRGLHNVDVRFKIFKLCYLDPDAPKAVNVTVSVNTPMWEIYRQWVEYIGKDSDKFILSTHGKTVKTHLTVGSAKLRNGDVFMTISIDPKD